jgi:hypothetical protein
VSGDGVTHLDSGVVLETDAGEFIAMTFGGLRSGPLEVMARLSAGQPVDPRNCYFRIQATFSPEPRIVRG